MFFTEKERSIYAAPNGRQYDPVVVDRRLTVLTGNRLRDLVLLRNAPVEGVGDVSRQGQDEGAVEAARAELTLADAARGAFDLPQFPECTAGSALEILYHFLDWLEGKGVTAGTPPASPESSPEPFGLPATRTS